MHDPRLPQLAAVLDGNKMAEALVAGCLASPHDWQVRGCRVAHIRYKPSKNCLARYDLTLTGGGLRDETRIWYGLAYEPGQSASRWERARKAPQVASAIGPGVAHLEALGMVVWAFPNDRKLHDIELLLHRDRLAAEVFGAGSETGAPQLVRYMPEQGCTVRLAYSGRNYFIKLSNTGDAESTCRHARALGREAWRTSGHGLAVHREVPGRPASEATDLSACARALARLHQHTLDGLPANADPTGSARLERARVLLAGRSSADSLIGALSHRCSASPHVVTVHGDLHVNNFLVAGEDAELIDLDTLQAGDPLEDLGSFAASLYHRALLAGDTIEHADAAIREFVGAYHAAVPWRLSASDISAHIARALVVERACRSITRCKGDVVAPLLAIARRILYTGGSAAPPMSARDWMEHFSAKARSRSGEVMDVHYMTYRKRASWPKSNVTVTWRDAAGIRTERIGSRPQSWNFPADPAAPWMSIAADPRAVIEHLPVPGASQVSIDVLNYRPQNRLTARYVVQAATGSVVLYGKTYSDNRGATVWRFFNELHRRGFPIPRPLGYSPAIRTVWQESFGGTPLLDCIGGPDGPRVLSHAASRLLFLHESGLRCPSPPFTFEGRHAELAKKIAKLAAVVPEHEARLMRVLEALRRTSDVLSGAPLRVVHGDFHIRQLMVRNGAVALFDFDEICRGDPAEDLGHFVADLHGYGWPVARVDEVARTLIGAYREQSVLPLPEERLRWHTAAHLMARAYRALLQLKPDFDERVSHHLQLAEALV